MVQWWKLKDGEMVGVGVCPRCRKDAGTGEMNCPHCGAALRKSVSWRSAPDYVKLQTASTIVLAVSCLLLFIEVFGVAKTYAGGLLCGVGFFLQGLSQRRRETRPDYEGKRKAWIIIAVSAVVALAGLAFLYLDLTRT